MTQVQHFRNFRWGKLMGIWEQRKVNLKAAVEREKAVQAIDVHREWKNCVVTFWALSQLVHFLGASRGCADFRDPTAVFRLNPRRRVSRKFRITMDSCFHGNDLHGEEEPCHFPIYRLPYKFFNSMALRVLVGGVCMWAIGGTAAWGEDSKVPSYTLQEVIDLTLTHNPIIELGKGIIEEKAGEEITAQSYPNPTFGVQSGYGRVRDPRGTSLIERYFSLSQPLEWPATRAARQQAAEAGVRSAHAGFEETQINVKARVKRTFF